MVDADALANSVVRFREQGIVLPTFAQLADPSTIDLDEDKVRDWLGKGAQPSDAVAKLLKVKNIG